MDEQRRRDANKELAEALGWTALEWAEEDADDFGVRVVRNWHGVAPDGVKRWLPDFTGSVDAVLDTLPERFGISIHAVMDSSTLEVKHYVASIDPFGDPHAPVDEDGYWTNVLADGATRAEAAANARLLLAQGGAHE